MNRRTQYTKLKALGKRFDELERKKARIDADKEALLPSLAMAKLKLEELPQRKVFHKKVTKFGYMNKPFTMVEVTAESDKYEFDSMMKSEIYQTERLIQMLERDIVYFTKKVTGWTLDVLPEIKYAGKFKAA